MIDSPKKLNLKPKSVSIKKSMLGKIGIFSGNFKLNKLRIFIKKT